MRVENFLVFGCLFIILLDYAVKSPSRIKRESEIGEHNTEVVCSIKRTREKLLKIFHNCLFDSKLKCKSCALCNELFHTFCCVTTNSIEVASERKCRMQIESWFETTIAVPNPVHFFSVHSNCKLDCEAEISMAMMEMISTSIRAAYRWTNSVEKFLFESIDIKISDDEVMRKTSCRLQCWIQVTEWRVYIVENHQNALIEHIIENSWRVMGHIVFDMAGFVVCLEHFPICQNGLLLTFQCMSQALI